MIEFGVIGTGAVARQFIEAAAADGGWTLRGVLGSAEAKALAFIESLGSAGAHASPFEQLDAFATSDTMRAVYVASPNSLHHHMTLRLLAAGKHVLVEKPAFSNLAETRSAYEAAEASGVLLLEAARHVFEDNYQTVKATVAGFGPIAGASFVFRQYSSRYPAYLAGQRPRIFTTEFSGGALADLGVYQLYAAIDWFGAPEDVRYLPRLLASGVDGEGVALLRYADFDLSLHISKVQASRQPNEIYGAGGSILSFNNVASVESASIVRRGDRDAAEVPLGPLAVNPLSEEIRWFGPMIEEFPATPAGAPYTPAELRGIGEQVSALSERLRKDGGVVFAADRS